MKLPNKDFVQISQQTVSELFNNTQGENSETADFFIGCGFDAADPGKLEDALLMHCSENEVSGTIEDDPGVKYIVSGALVAPNGSKPAVTSIWFIETGEEIPIFITAYPQTLNKGLHS